MKKGVQANEWLRNMSGEGRGCFGVSGCKMSIHKKKEKKERRSGRKKKRKKNQEGIMKLGMGRGRKRKQGLENLKH